MQIEGNDDPKCGAPECLNEVAEVGVHEADAVVPWEEVVCDAVPHIQEDAVHACREERVWRRLTILLLAEIAQSMLKSGKKALSHYGNPKRFYCK